LRDLRAPGAFLSLRASRLRRVAQGAALAPALLEAGQ
jgi:hypothetical protein